MLPSIGSKLHLGSSLSVGRSRVMVVASQPACGKNCSIRIRGKSAPVSSAIPSTAGSQAERLPAWIADRKILMFLSGCRIKVSVDFICTWIFVPLAIDLLYQPGRSKSRGESQTIFTMSASCWRSICSVMTLRTVN
jgi:hypothetical protein